MDKYELIDSGELQKLERFGPYLIQRPCPVAYWPKQKPKLWKEVDATFTRDKKNTWIFHKKIPESWIIKHEGILFKVSPTEFGHLGIFPEHNIKVSKKIKGSAALRAINLFGYTGGISVALAKEEIEVCHVDASKKSVAWAKENAALNKIPEDKIRWIVDDCRKFLKREAKRESYYDIIILDPPTYGRGTKKEVFLLEEEINELLALCKSCLSKEPKQVIFSCHTLSFTPLVMQQLLAYHFGENVQSGEMSIHAKESMTLPCGTLAIWEEK